MLASWISLVWTWVALALFHHTGADRSSQMADAPVILVAGLLFMKKEKGHSVYEGSDGTVRLNELPSRTLQGAFPRLKLTPLEI